MTLLTDGDLAAALPDVLGEWGLDGATVEPLGGGMNSATATVATAGARYVAKWVPGLAHDALASGAALASQLADAGLLTGAPRLTLDGELVAPLGEGWCALLNHVPGRPLSGDTAEEQRIMGELLGSVHGVTVCPASAGAFLEQFFADESALAIEPWVAPAVADARAAYAALRGLTHAWLHTDPAPEAFLHEAVSGSTGLIDWTGAQPGPVLYDVASATMYLGEVGHAESFLDSYAAARVSSERELNHLDVMLRFRWAVQAAYFAGRILAGDLTGIDEPGNHKGLADARRGLGV